MSEEELEDWRNVYSFIQDQYPEGFSKNELRIMRNILKKGYDQQQTKKKKWISNYTGKAHFGGWGSFH
tara:strand:- start:265 stop:468 length:204 start_codon:yes stop_codon:yes gene_type:complete